MKIKLVEGKFEHENINYNPWNALDSADWWHFVHTLMKNQCEKIMRQSVNHVPACEDV